MKTKTSYQNGFTLIELMVVVAVVGILAAIAIPSYQESLRKSRRADAQGALMSFANGMERHYTQFNSYCDVLNTAKTTASTAADCGGGGNDTGTAPGSVFAARGETANFYTFTIFAATPNTFTLRATPVAGTAQSTDGLMELLSTGVQRWDQNNNGVATDAGEDSWKKK